MKKILVLTVAVLALVCCTEKAPRYANRAEAIAAQIHDPNSKYVVVTCHRGDWRNFPENSIPAIESIIRMGADIMELDLKMTADSVLVLSHDGTVSRCTNFSSVFRNEPARVPKSRTSRSLKSRASASSGRTTSLSTPSTCPRSARPSNAARTASA